MTRLQDPDPNDIPEDVARFLADFPPDPMFKMLTHSPSTVQPFIGLAQALYTSLELPARARELAILTLAEGVQCDFVLTQHVPISRDAGVDDATRELIKNGDHTNPALSRHDRAVIQFAAEVVADLACPMKCSPRQVSSSPPANSSSYFTSAATTGPSAVSALSWTCNSPRCTRSCKEWTAGRASPERSLACGVSQPRRRCATCSAART